MTTCPGPEEKPKLEEKPKPPIFVKPSGDKHYACIQAGFDSPILCFTYGIKSIISVMQEARRILNSMGIEQPILCSDELCELLWGTDLFYLEDSAGRRLAGPTPDFVHVLELARTKFIKPGSKIRRESDGATLAYQTQVKKHMLVPE